MMDHMRCPECQTYQREYFGHMGEPGAIWECGKCETKLGYQLEYGCMFRLILVVISGSGLVALMILGAFAADWRMGVPVVLAFGFLILFVNRIEKVSEDRESSREKRRLRKDPRRIKIGSRDVRF